MLRGLLFFLLLVGLSAGAAHAERRVALLLGNSAYPDRRSTTPTMTWLYWNRPFTQQDLK